MSQTNEKAFESYVESILLTQSGWDKGEKAKWDKDRALFPEDVLAFIQATQPKLWQSMEKQHGAELGDKLIKILCQELDVKGLLFVLRKGFKFYGKTFYVAYFKPAHGLNWEMLELYKKNTLTITRQVPCNPRNNDTVDMLLSLNGLPLATCELKNPNTGQNWQHAVRQYREDRHPEFPLFQFKKRALVHFAADPEQIYMTTRLEKEDTVFLPFNQGSHPGEIQCGAGNPQHPSGYRTGYFWEESLQSDHFLEIIGSFVFVEKKEKKIDDGSGRKKRVEVETMVFPRYHQLDAVKKLVALAREEGAGQHYLVQHSAGSGKTNSISWLAHQLSSLHNTHDEKLFDCVVIISDRQVLDQQLQDAIYQIDHAQGVVQAIDDNSQQLAKALVDDTKIVVTTLQKFPFVLGGLLRIAGTQNLDSPKPEELEQARVWQEKIASRRYAVIVDEAHSSQSGEIARELKGLLGMKATEDEEKEEDWQDGLNEVMKSRGQQKNVSFFAFTATPKAKTLELFGRMGPSGKPEAFHLYSMRQAIEERFILDVLQNYTTYKRYYRLVKAVADDPAMPKKKTAQALARYMELHPVNVEQKIAIIVEHFRSHVKHQLGGRAKAMVVTGSRLHALRYMLAFQRYINEHNYQDIRPLVAFSGKIKDPDTGLEYTEPDMNLDVVTGKKISEAQLPDRFDTPDYQVLLVANKYQTGFDQPLLCAMYVDKRLDGVQAVQTLSRLNRRYAGKQEPFVLDFVNDPTDIFAAFKPYFDATLLEETTDPRQLEDLKFTLSEKRVYVWAEVEAFAKVFYKPLERQHFSDHAQLEKQLQPAVERFNALPEEKQKDFRDKLQSYVRLYAFLSQIMPYADPELEMLYSYGRLLVQHLRLFERDLVIQPNDKVSLKYYRLDRISSGAIPVHEGVPPFIKGPTDVGTAGAKDENAPLSTIIGVLNERFGTEFTREDELFFDQIKEKACSNEQIIQTATMNPLDKFELGVRKVIESLIIQRMSENDDIVTRYMDDKDFQDTAYTAMVQDIYQTILARIAKA
jgi:type I restriction enzyme R subunit